MDSQIFIAICLFLLGITGGLAAIGTIILTLTNSEERKVTSKKMIEVGVVMSLVIVAVIFYEIQNPTNPTVVHTANEFIMK